MVAFVLCLPAGFCLSILLFWGWYNMLSGFVIGFVLCLRVLGFRFRLSWWLVCAVWILLVFCCVVCWFSEFAAGGGLIVVFGLIVGALGWVCGPAFGVWFLRLRFGFGLGLRVGCC